MKSSSEAALSGVVIGYTPHSLPHLSLFPRYREDGRADTCICLVIIVEFCRGWQSSLGCHSLYVLA
jgi:hypothetical protein